MLRIKRLGLSKAGNYMVKVYSDTQSKTENFTLVVRSKPKVQVSIANPQDLYQVCQPYSEALNLLPGHSGIKIVSLSIESSS